MTSLASMRPKWCFNLLADQHGVTLFDGDNWAGDPEVLELVGLPEKDFPDLLQWVEQHTSSYVVGAA